MTVQNSLKADVAQRAMQAFADRMQDPLQALADVQVEDEANCTIGAGYGLGASIGASGDSADVHRQRQQRRILLSGEFCQMLTDCNLGAGLPDAIRVGKRILAERLKQPSEDIQRQLMTALDRAISLDETNEGIPDSVRSKVRRAICAVLSEQDWEAISSAATTAIQINFRQKIAGSEAA